MNEDKKEIVLWVLAFFIQLLFAIALILIGELNT
jgi:hypothetical protein